MAVGALFAAVVAALTLVTVSASRGAGRVRRERDAVRVELATTDHRLASQRERADGLDSELGAVQGRLTAAQAAAANAEQRARRAEAKALADAQARLRSQSTALDARAAQVSAREAAVRTAEGELNAHSFGGDGIYAVGTDIQPGTYYSATPGSGNCYYAVLRSPDTEDVNDIVTNNNSAGPTIVAVSAGEYLDVDGCDSFVLR